MKKYLVMQLARFGDLLQTKRLLLTLADLGETHLAVDASLAPLAGLVYPFAVVHPIKAHAGGVSEEDVFASNASGFARLEIINFEKIYNLNRNAMSLALAGLFPPEKVVGYRLDNGQAIASLWPRMAARWTRARRSSPINLMDFWAYFHPTPIDAAQVNPVARPKNAPGAAGGQRIGVALAGRESRRSLPPQVLAPILEAMFEARKGPELVLLGGKSEQEAARLLQKNLRTATRDKVRDLSGQTSLTDLYEVVDGLDLVVTPDTGIMHLAAHLGVPVMATFLSSAWAWETGPYGLGHTVWQAARSCSPCLESAACPYDVACLDPFKSADFLQHLSGRNSGGWPNGLLGLVSAFDSLGVTYMSVDGEEPPAQAEERRAKRALLAEYLGLLAPAERPANIPQHIVEDLFAETDWILPQGGEE